MVTMQAACFTCASVLFLAACAPAQTQVAKPPQSQAAGNLTPAQKAAIGRKIWQNESGGAVTGLTAWNAGEEFPSLGIGHFIWYPAGFKGRFSESWPQWVAYARQRGLQPPALAMERHCPWNSRSEFQRDFNSARMIELRNWLAGHVEVQTDYIIARSRAALPKILAAAPASEKSRIEANYRKVATTPQGTYALIDYVNFKGDGTQTAERYQGRGWGLLQVLGGMKEVPTGAPAATEFAASAKRILSRRIADSPLARGERQWEEGWHNRCSTYARPL
jgi:hypothetical protein